MAVVTLDLLRHKKAAGQKILANLESPVLPCFRFNDGIPPSPNAPGQRGLNAPFCVRRMSQVKSHLCATIIHMSRVLQDNLGTHSSMSLA